jgi:hypothetical protein
MVKKDHGKLSKEYGKPAIFNTDHIIAKRHFCKIHLISASLDLRGKSKAERVKT